MGIGVWAELLDDEIVRAALPELARHGSRLALAIGSNRLGDAALAELTRQAADVGVAVRAWLLLPREHGYWIGETNVDELAVALARLCTWRTQRGGPALEGVSVDLEPDYAYSEALRTTKKSRPAEWLKLLASHVDRRQFEAARDRLARVVEHTSRQGLAMHAVTHPLLLDQPDADVTLEDALDTPVSGIDWDELSVMVYQTAFAQQIGRWLGPDLVRSYALDCVKRYGDRAGIDLGVIGSLGVGLDPGDRYAAPADFRADLAAALSAGISIDRIRAYGLGGVLESGAPACWLDVGGVAASVPDPSREVAGVRNGARALCVLLGQLSGHSPKR